MHRNKPPPTLEQSTELIQHYLEQAERVIDQLEVVSAQEAPDLPHLHQQLEQLKYFYQEALSCITR